MEYKLSNTLQEAVEAHGEPKILLLVRNWERKQAKAKAAKSNTAELSDAKVNRLIRELPPEQLSSILADMKKL